MFNLHSHCSSILAVEGVRRNLVENIHYPAGLEGVDVHNPAEEADHNLAEEVDHIPVEEIDHSPAVVAEVGRNPAVVGHSHVEVVDHSSVEVVDHSLAVVVDHSSVEVVDHKPVDVAVRSRLAGYKHQTVLVGEHHVDRFEAHHYLDPHVSPRPVYRMNCL